MSDEPTYQDKEKNELLLKQLKGILLKETRQDINHLQHTLNTPGELKKKVNPIFEERMVQLKKSFPLEFGEMMNKMIEVKLKASEEQLLNIIYPVLGQMIRKYIAHQFEAMKESIDKRMTQTFSYKNLKNKLKATFLGVSDSELILQDLNKIQIQEIFVIQHNSGLLLGSYSTTNMMDRDMVAGMLTAIKSFSEDTFNINSQDLDLIDYGNHKILIQNFYQYYFAMVLSGIATAKEKQKLSTEIMQFAEKEMTMDMTIVSDELNRVISEKLKIYFEKNDVVSNK